VRAFHHREMIAVNATDIDWLAGELGKSSGRILGEQMAPVERSVVGPRSPLTP